MRTRALALLLPALLLFGCGGEDEREGRPVTLALDFTPNAVHAGIYVARERRLDRERGVVLRIRAPSASTDSLKLLTSGRADLAVVDIHDLGLARERGQDIVGVAGLVRRPLAAVIARSAVRRPRELEGRRVGVTGLASDEAVLRSVVEADGGRLGRVRRVTIGFSAVPSLIAGKVDAATAFWNAEGVTLRERGFRTREFRVDDYGAPAYPELVLVAKRETLDERGNLVEDAVSALAAGAEAALERPELAVRLIADASGADESLVRAQLVALGRSLAPPLEPERRALERWADFDRRFGILTRRPEVERAFPLTR